MSVGGGRPGQKAPHLLHKIYEDVHVDDAQQNQESRTHARSDDATDSRERVELAGHGIGGRGHGQGGDDDDAGQLVSRGCVIVWRGHWRACVEWPRENHVPTVTGSSPVAVRRRVMRSMACGRCERDAGEVAVDMRY